MLVARYGALFALLIRRASQREDGSDVELNAVPLEPAHPLTGVSAGTSLSQAVCPWPGRLGQSRTRNEEFTLFAIIVVKPC